MLNVNPEKILRVLLIIVLVFAFAASVVTTESLNYESMRVVSDQECSQRLENHVAIHNFVRTAHAAWNPVPLITWLIGGIWSRPQNFERSNGAYVLQKIEVPEEFQSIFGPYILIHPMSRLGKMSEAGIEMQTWGDSGWNTDADVEFHKDRDRRVKKATVEISFVPATKDSKRNSTPRMTLWEENFENSNGAEIRVFPPRSVAKESQNEWSKVFRRFKDDDEDIVLTVSTYVDDPTKMKASQSFRVVVSKLKMLGLRSEFQKNGLGLAIQIGNKHENDRLRQEKGISVRALVKTDNSLNSSHRPVGLAIFDSLGEVYRGDVVDGQEFKIIPDEKTKMIRITQLENEAPLGMVPETPLGKDGKQTGFVCITQDNTEFAVYPISNFVADSKPRKLRGQVKIYAQRGSQIPLEFSAKGEGTSRTTVNVSRFGGRVIDVWSDNPQREISVSAYLGGRKYTKKITAEQDQVIFDCESRTPVRQYATINVNPAVPGGIHSKNDLARYAISSHFLQNLRQTGVDEKEIEIFRKQALSCATQYTKVGPEVKRFTEHGASFVSTNMVKALTECGPGGRPVGHKVFYQTTFKDYHRVWIPTNRYGWVPGIISTCGNAVMVYIPPPQYSRPPTPPQLGIAPPPERPMQISFDSLIISVTSIDQGNLVITPSSIASYVPETKIDIRNSQSQSQNQSQNQISTNINNNTNTNVNNNTNINNVDVDVNNTNNNINQNQQILNNANANN